MANNIMLQNVIHFFFHFGFPFVIAYFLQRDKWFMAGLIMSSTIIIDIDHLWANPIYESCRCSIGFHPFHSLPVILLYPIFVVFPKTRLIGIGLTLHMLTDYIDCLFIKFNCF